MCKRNIPIAENTNKIKLNRHYSLHIEVLYIVVLLFPNLTGFYSDTFETI